MEGMMMASHRQEAERVASAGPSGLEGLTNTLLRGILHALLAIADGDGAREQDDLDEMLDKIKTDPEARAAYENARLRDSQDVAVLPVGAGNSGPGGPVQAPPDIPQVDAQSVARGLFDAGRRDAAHDVFLIMRGSANYPSPEPVHDKLRRIGEWLKENGETW
jgi:hypothetical protein